MTDKQEPIEKVEWIEFDEFKDHMALLQCKGVYPLECVGIQKYEDAKGEFFLPSITTYMGDTFVTGDKDGYLSRERALAVVGRALDKIMNE